MTILVEGVDLTGKSTLVAGLGAALGGAPTNAGPIRRGALARLALRRYRSGADPIGPAQTWLFVAATLADAGARRLATVQETYVDHTIALAEVLGRSVAAALCRAALPLLPRFDATIYLRAEPDVRRRRLAERPTTDRIDRLLLDDPAAAAELERRLFARVRRRPRLLVLDSGRLDRQQMIASAVAHVLP